MKTTTVNSPFNPFFNLVGLNRQNSTKNHSRNLGTQPPFFYQDWNLTLHTYNQLGLDFQITDPKTEDVKIFELKSEEKHENSPDFPLREKRDEVKPNREEPKEDNDLEDDEDIIEEPTRELDDPYRPGHGDRDDIPQKEEDDPKTDSKKNSKH